jgi:hypothetical protein
MARAGSPGRFPGLCRGEVPFRHRDYDRPVLYSVTIFQASWFRPGRSAAMSPATVSAADQADASLAIARLMEEGFSQGNLEVIEELISPDCAEHQRGNGLGAAGAKRVVSTLHSWFSGFRLESQDLVTHDGTVWIRQPRDRDQYRPLRGIRAHRQDDRHHRVRRRAYRGRAGRRALGRHGSTGGSAAAGPVRRAWPAGALTPTAAGPARPPRPRTGITCSRACPATPGQKWDITRK